MVHLCSLLTVSHGRSNCCLPAAWHVSSAEKVTCACNTPRKRNHARPRAFATLLSVSGGHERMMWKCFSKCLPGTSNLASALSAFDACKTGACEYCANFDAFMESRICAEVSSFFYHALFRPRELTKHLPCPTERSCQGFSTVHGGCQAQGAASARPRGPRAVRLTGERKLQQRCLDGALRSDS